MTKHLKMILRLSCDYLNIVLTFFLVLKLSQDVLGKSGPRSSDKTDKSRSRKDRYKVKLHVFDLLLICCTTSTVVQQIHNVSNEWSLTIYSKRCRDVYVIAGETNNAENTSRTLTTYLVLLMERTIHPDVLDHPRIRERIYTRSRSLKLNHASTV